MSKTYTVRAVAMNVSGERFIALEIPKEVIETLNLVDGETLDAEVTDKSLSLVKTGVIINDDRSD